MDIPTYTTLDLSNAPSTLFIFGLAGSGKSFIGDLIGELAGWHVYHADEDLTDDMREALEQEKPFTEAMRDEFFLIITEKILQLQKSHNKLVVTQAVYKQRHRVYLLAKIPHMDMIMVDAADSLILQRIEHRYEGISKYSAVALRQDFERPDAEVKIIVNDRDRLHIVGQLNQFYGNPINCTA